jgi:hypothetical protein
VRSQGANVVPFAYVAITTKFNVHRPTLTSACLLLLLIGCCTLTALAYALYGQPRPPLRVRGSVHEPQRPGSVGT